MPVKSSHLPSVIAALVAALALASCSGGNSGLTPQSAAPALSQNRFAGKVLLYVSDNATWGLFMYAYSAKPRFLRFIRMSIAPQGICVDRNQNVYVTTFSYSIFEFAHGGTRPIFVLANPAGYGSGCAVNPQNGDLAVVGEPLSIGNTPQVAVFRNGRGQPKLYTATGFVRMTDCAYDDSGNLYVDGQKTGNYFAFGELSSGAKSVQQITLNQSIEYPGGVQWDGAHVAVGDSAHPVIYEFAISGSAGTETGKTPLDGAYNALGFYIADASVIVPTFQQSSEGVVGIYGYPAGGSPTRILRDFSNPVSAAVSLKT